MNKRERLQRRVDRILATLELDRVEQLAQFNERDLRCLPRLGNITFREIERRLKAKKLSLKHYDGVSTAIAEPVRRALRTAGPNKNTRHFKDSAVASLTAHRRR